jgi:hemerythrin
MVNDFYDGVTSDDRKALGSLLTSLIEYTLYHFGTEEKYMKKFNYFGTATHIKEHQSFVEKATDVKKRFDSGKLVLSLEITNFVKDWIVDHVMGTDKKYSQCFIANGLKSNRVK